MFETDIEVKGDFDENMRAFSQHQIHLSNRIEDLTGLTLYGTKRKFDVYDAHIVRHNNPRMFCGTASLVPGLPLYWEYVDGIAELKYRQMPSSRFPTTYIDAHKYGKLIWNAEYLNLPCWIIWAYQDKDMYYKINKDHLKNFKQVLTRNTHTTQDLKHEYKPVVEIPMNYLKTCTPTMFNQEMN